ncbi:hypothetical protein CRENBAI_008729 [Crenichthys baileyi]|uniref:Uncharacterized protein n=1 Tax=Crenichthys baileyi TaxID=28760 RepID=A0AAV9RFW2_9TELE
MAEGGGGRGGEGRIDAAAARRTGGGLRCREMSEGNDVSGSELGEMDVGCDGGNNEGVWEIQKIKRKRKTSRQQTESSISEVEGEADVMPEFKVVLKFVKEGVSFGKTGSRGQQTQQRHPEVPLPRHLLQLLRGEPKAFPGQPRDSPSSVSWTVPWAYSRWDVPGTPPEEGIQEEASGIDARATSTGSSRCGGAAAPPEWPSSSPYL